MSEKAIHKEDADQAVLPFGEKAQAIKPEPRIERRKDDYEAFERDGKWFIRNTTQGRNLMGDYNSEESALRTIARIKTSLGQWPQTVLRALIRCGQTHRDELRNRELPNVVMSDLQKTLMHLKRKHFAKCEAEMWQATDMGKLYAGLS